MQELFSDEKTEKVARKLLDENSLCDKCINRLFYKKNETFEKEKAKLIRNHFNKKEVKTKDCSLCKGLLNEIESFVELILDKLKDYEF